MSARRHNPFIVIESLDAGGGSTQTALLVKHLRRVHRNCLQLHFPQVDRATGRLIYDKFLKPKNKLGFSRREQALLYIQDFFSGAEAIERHLAQSKPAAVVTDRFYTSTMAYQTIGLTGAPRKTMLKWITDICRIGKPALFRPDLVFLLDLPVEISLQHLKNRKQDFFENKRKLTAIRASYLRLAKEQKWIVINSVDNEGQQRSKQDIHQEIWSYVVPLL